MFGKKFLNSVASWAARVLLCDITSVGFCMCCIIFAIVKVLPVQVAHSKVIFDFPDSKISLISLIAFGWSPAGEYDDLSSNINTVYKVIKSKVYKVTNHCHCEE
ncbi:MAG: hypothetical protein WCG25_07850 [bacterium]